MNWFRFHVEAIDNLKVQSLPGDLFKTWINLLCLARMFGGQLPDISTCAFRLRKTEIEMRSEIEMLKKKRLLEENQGRKLAPHDWDDFQYASDNSTDRVKKHREKRAVKREGNVSVTPPDTDTDTDTEETHPLPPSAEGAAQALLIPAEPSEPAASFDDVLMETAARIRERHPAKRRCSVKEAADRLRAIVRQVPAEERPDRLCQIEAVHAKWCESEQWQKQDGEFAKGLDNWLAPTKGRFDSEPPPQNGNGFAHPERIPTANERRRLEVVHGLEMLDRIQGRA